MVDLELWLWQKLIFMQGVLVEGLAIIMRGSNQQWRKRFGQCKRAYQSRQRISEIMEKISFLLEASQN